MSNDVAIVLFADPVRDRAAQGLIGAGERLAAELHGALHAFSIDPQQYQPEDALHALSAACRELAPRAILLANDTYSQELTPRLAHRLGGSAAGDAVEITGALRVRRQVYGGKAEAIIQLKRAPAVVWLRARTFGAGQRVPEVRSLALDGKGPSRIVERTAQGPAEARLDPAHNIRI